MAKSRNNEKIGATGLGTIPREQIEKCNQMTGRRFQTVGVGVGVGGGYQKCPSSLRQRHKQSGPIDHEAQYQSWISRSSINPYQTILRLVIIDTMQFGDLFALVCLSFFQRSSIAYVTVFNSSGQGFRPDRTETVDWALTSNNLPTHHGLQSTTHPYHVTLC